MISKKNIKKHLYIDEPMINSYISQIYGGITNDIQLLANTIVKKETSNTIGEKSSSVSAEGGIPFVRAKMELPQHSTNNTINEGYSDTNGKNLRKTLDTNFNINLFLQSVLINDENNIEDAEIIEINHNLQLLDFIKLKEILEDDYFPTQETGNRQERRTTKKDKKNATILTENQKNIKMIDTILKFMPSSLIFYNDRFLIPVDESKLLCERKQITYKHKGEITIIGEFVGDFQTINNFDIKTGGLAGINKELNTTIKEVFTIALGTDASKLKIINPIIAYSQSECQISPVSLDDL